MIAICVGDGVMGAKSKVARIGRSHGACVGAVGSCWRKTETAVRAKNWNIASKGNATASHLH